MGSNSIATFLTKLLRPDKKSKQKENNVNKRRHSAPGPDWLDIFDVITKEDDGRKLPNKNHKQKEKYSSHQNLSTVKIKKGTKTKQDDSKGKRQSAAFPSWFCVSGNTDTLDRTPLTAPINVNINNRNISNIQKSSNGGVPLQADFLRQGEGKKTRDNKNRYSAPVPGWTAPRAPINHENPKCKFQTKTPTAIKPRRDLSPPPSYRYEGTLEKPYVFPAGLTFGPEGRKLQLRRTTSSQTPDNARNSHRPNEKVVKVDVHRSSTEDILMEYIYEESGPDSSEFDVRKAFYLKYDSNFSYPVDDQDRIDSYDLNREPQYEEDVIRDSQLDTDAAIDGKSHERRWKPKQSTTNTNYNSGSRGTSKRLMKTDRSKNRYSMPPKNEDCVYMGSFENVNMYDHLEVDNEMSKSNLDISGKERSSGRDNKKRNRCYRYSLPPRNTDLVFMGSLENVNQLLTGDKGSICNLSLPHENAKIDVNMEPQVGERQNRSIPVEHDRSEGCTVHDDNTDNSVAGYNRAKVENSGLTTYNARYEHTESSSQRKRVKTQSSPDVTYSTNLSIAAHGELVDSELENEADDLFDISSLPNGRTRSATKDGPFSRFNGRSSCMPGNKRSIAPPPAVMNNSFSATSYVSNLGMSTFQPGNKRFSIPPPPNYTPPKEEMEFTHGRLKEMTCHKGSQTDLSLEFEIFNMEDRDTSLQREDVKTIGVGVSSLTLETDNGESAGSVSSIPTRDHSFFVLRGKTESLACSPNVEPSTNQLDISNNSQGSDEVFRDNQSSYNDVNEHKLFSRFAEISTTQSSHLDNNHFVKVSPVSPGTDLDKKSNSASTVARRLILSESSGKKASSDCRTSITSTPKDNHHSQLNWPRDSSSSVVQERPVPYPRKIYDTADLTERAEPFLTLQKQMQQTCTHSRSRPVPKERHSLTYSRSLSSAEEYEKKLVTAQYSSPDDMKKSNIQKLTRTMSCEPHGTLQSNQKSECSNLYAEDGTKNGLIKYEHVYESIDFRSNPSRHKDTYRKNEYSSLSGQDERKHIHVYTSLPAVTSENIYEECGDMCSEKEYRKENSHRSDNDNADKQKEFLSPLQKIKLDASPGQTRRNRIITDCPINDQPGQLTKYCGLASSLDDIFERGRWNDWGGDKNSSTDKSNIYDVIDDNNSIADDEMSNDEDTEERVKQLSLRRCVSADNLLRSGSILDRSMILAKKRRKRTRERQFKSYLSSSSATECFLDVSMLNSKNGINKISHKVHYNKKKTTSNERLFKHKASHTDSGHDSDMVSPCTSPDTGRHADKMTSLNYAHSAYDLIENLPPRQGTLPKKPWEIRLMNTQYRRKSRSRESLVNLNLEPRPVFAYLF